jgi:hypothetical protein
MHFFVIYAEVLNCFCGFKLLNGAIANLIHYAIEVHSFN